MPLNCNMNRMGMASYPVGFDTNIAATKKYNNPNLNKNKLGEVRSMVYPTIDLIYKACNEAKVDCGHLYLYRPPDQVLQSTISIVITIIVYWRQFNYIQHSFNGLNLIYGTIRIGIGDVLDYTMMI
ncbi:hypothetical protein FRACYDRAFT_221159 [Fragilariopsis cylindrus CCMP1102]|uniref:Uncharacterized protein n=1 Tax=Fragilariopsis cylindrus CCMP1102 TaxID=635003 RepID=A0A1E7ENC6_9STRA|nr:hypothetical protein FRACYDRAFT_221159 [Fragilariopsis cylindrus CCMP1102]|eukprot:OEU07469.1 hypothetical protein FRACYDRAFT_221159 [Fragilariopsis cylindrus CCMP1102]